MAQIQGILKRAWNAAFMKHSEQVFTRPTGDVITRGFIDEGVENGQDRFVHVQLVVPGDDKYDQEFG